MAQILQRGTATRRDRQQGPDHADEIRGRHQPVTLSEAGKLCLRAVQRWGSDQHREIHNEALKESRGAADWVIVTAIDEHLELVGGRDQRAYLQECRSSGVTLVPAIGYQMIRRQFPDPTWRLASKVTTGAPYDVMSKLSIFDPNAIVSPGFGVGRHRAQPEGKVRYPAHDRMMLLHYKYLGFVAAYRRQRALAQGLGTTDIQNRWGRQYLRGPFKHLRTWWNFERKAVDVGRPGFDPSSPSGHKGRIWWRT